MALIAAIGCVGRWSPVSAQRVPAASAPVVVTNPIYAHYTEAQAARGEKVFDQHCAYCHSLTPGKPSPVTEKFGQYDPPLVPGLITRASRHGLALYPSVWYLFRRLEMMPIDGVDKVTRQQRADVLAYLLKKNGMPAGRTEVPANRNATKGMLLPAEPGFEHLFNGKDFTGLKFNLGYNCSPAPEGCGQTTPAPGFSIVDGAIQCTGKKHGFMYTEKKYLNFTLRMDRRVIEPEGWNEDPALHADQGGIFLFNDSMRVWPKTFLEVEGRTLDLLRVGGRKATDDDDARKRAMRRFNEWNALEVVVKNGTIKTYLNGTLVASAEDDGRFREAPIAWQSQGSLEQWRNIRIRVE